MDPVKELKAKHLSSIIGGYICTAAMSVLTSITAIHVQLAFESKEYGLAAALATLTVFTGKDAFSMTKCIEQRRQEYVSEHRMLRQQQYLDDVFS